MPSYDSYLKEGVGENENVYEYVHADLKRRVDVKAVEDARDTSSSEWTTRRHRETTHNAMGCSVVEVAAR